MEDKTISVETKNIAVLIIKAPPSGAGADDDYNFNMAVSVDQGTDKISVLHNTTLDKNDVV